MKGVVKNKEVVRCSWADPSSELYLKYHDEEWGVPVHDDRVHFEFLVLEAAQSGLSWITILKKREGYRKAFAGFDPATVARFDEKKVATLLKDASIVRNNLKIRAAIQNAKVFLAIQKEFGSFDTYIWDFVNGKQIVNAWKAGQKLPASTPLSERISKDLKKRGMTFVGPVVIYSHLQAVGLVNDHRVDCFRYNSIGKISARQVQK